MRGKKEREGEGEKERAGERENEKKNEREREHPRANLKHQLITPRRGRKRSSSVCP